MQTQLSSLNTKFDDLQAQIAELQSPRKGVLSIPAIEFSPNAGGNLTESPTSTSELWASVQLQNEVTVTNMTAYLLDQPHEFNPWIELDLIRYNLKNSSIEIMAHVETDPVGGSWEWQTYYDATINQGQIDNEKFLYGLRVLFHQNGLGWRVKAVLLEYEYLL